MVRRFALSGALLALLAACTTGQARPAQDPVEGLIVGIEGDTMTLRTQDGSEFTFTIDDSSVPVEHLREHQDQRLPVSVDWQGDDELIAVKIRDA